MRETMTGTRAALEARFKEDNKPYPAALTAEFARAHNDYLDYDRHAAIFGEEYEEPEAFAPPSYVAGMAAEIWRIREQADRQGDIALLLSGNQEALIHWNFALAAEVALKALEKGN